MTTMKHIVGQFLPPVVKRPLRAGYEWWRRKSYTGYCPLCRQPVAGFLPLFSYLPALKHDLEKYGFNMGLLNHAEMLNLEAYACPNCYGSDRERFFALFIDRRLAQTPRAERLKILDIAPSGALRRYLDRTDRFEYRSADLSSPGVDDYVDLQDMSLYADGQFDCFICSHVMEHVPDDRLAMRELYRVLKTGGWGIALAPIFLNLSETVEDPTESNPRERVRRFGQADHIRMYARRDFIERLGEAGFSVRQLRGQDFPPGVFESHGITPQSVLYICEKPKGDRA